MRLPLPALIPIVRRLAAIAAGTFLVASPGAAQSPTPPAGSPQIMLPSNADQAPARGRVRQALDGLRVKTYSATQNGAFMARSGATIGPAWVDGAYRAVETPHDVPIARLVISGLKATNLARDGIRLCLASNVVIEDFDIQHAATPSSGKDLPEGIALGSNHCGEAGHDIVIRNGRVGGFQMTVPEGHYRNGDGIAIEGGYDRVLIENVQSSDNSDGCFDIKASNLTLRDLSATGCNRAYRIWSPSAEATTLTARDFNGAGIWLGHGANLHVHRFVAAGGHEKSIVFRWEDGVTLKVDECDLSGLAPGAILTKADGHAASISLGEGCKLP